MRRKLCLILVAVWGMALLAGCGGETQNVAPSSPQTAFPTAGLESSSTEPEATHETDKKEQTTMKVNVQIGAQTFTATLADTTAAQEFAQMLPMTITLDDYGGFEKVGSLGRSLTTSNSQTTTTAGDIVLYNGSSIVMFYGSNSWSYTRLGKIDDLTGWAVALGHGSVSVTFRLVSAVQ